MNVGVNSKFALQPWILWFSFHSHPISSISRDKRRDYYWNEIQNLELEGMIDAERKFSASFAISFEFISKQQILINLITIGNGFSTVYWLFRLSAADLASL